MKRLSAFKVTVHHLWTPCSLPYCYIKWKVASFSCSMQFLFSCEIFHLNWMIKVNHYLVELGNWCRNCSLRNMKLLKHFVWTKWQRMCNVTQPSITLVCSHDPKYRLLSLISPDGRCRHWWGRDKLRFILETIPKYFCIPKYFFVDISSHDWQLVYYQLPLSDRIALEHTSTIPATVRS